MTSEDTCLLCEDVSFSGVESLVDGAGVCFVFIFGIFGKVR